MSADGVQTPPVGQIKARAFFTPFFASMMGIVLFSLAIAFYHFVLHKYCLRRHPRRAAAHAAAQPPTSTYTASGVDKILLQTVPIFTVGELKIDERECIVCLGELEDEDRVRLLPNCKHAFHLECIDQWFVAHDSCPLCRSPILTLEMDDCKPVDNDAVHSSSVNEINNNNNNNNRSDRDSSNNNNVSGTTVNGDESTSSSSSAAAAAEVQLDVLRHSVSMVSRPRMPVIELKRSLSMDQSSVAIDLERGRSSNRENGSLDSSTGVNQLTRSHFDRLLRSFSRLRSARKEDHTGSGTTTLPS